MTDGERIFHAYATHGVPLAICLVALGGKRVNWRQYVDAARANGWQDRRILAVMTEAMRDAEYKGMERVIDLTRAYMLRYPNG